MKLASPIKIENLKFYPEVRKICESNGCGNYNTNWTCPPAMGTLEECKKICMKYTDMILFSNQYQLEDSWDIEGMQQGHIDFQHITDNIEDKINVYDKIEKYMILSNEGCLRCEKCAYPEPCRFPDKLHPALEGFGFIVSELAKEAGMPYYNKDCVTYFGAVLFK